MLVFKYCSEVMFAKLPPDQPRSDQLIEVDVITT